MYIYICSYMWTLCDVGAAGVLYTTGRLIGLVGFAQSSAPRAPQFSDGTPI